MAITFETMTMQHQSGIMEIFNHYIETSTAAFPGARLPEPFFAMLLKKSEGYTAYALVDDETGKAVGFCQMSAFNPFSSFATTACVTYFIADAYTNRSLGAMCLERLEKDAKEKGITQLVAEISSENEGSINFHKKHGFVEAGRLKDVANKFGRTFSVVYFQKTL